MDDAITPPGIGLTAGIAPPTSTLANDYKLANNASDLYSLSSRASGTTLAPSILRSAQMMESAAIPIQQAMDTSNAKGGIQTPEGRMALSDSIKNTYDKYQPETGFLKGLAAGMMGVKNWQNLASQGVITPMQEFDKDGKGAVAFYAANSSMPTKVIDKLTGQEIPDTEYESRGFGKYKAITETPGYVAQDIRTKALTTNLIKEQGEANTSAAVFPLIGENSKQIYTGFSNLRKFGLTDSEINGLQQQTTNTQAITSAVSSASQQMSQATDAESLKVAVDKLNKVAANAGIPEIVSVNGANSLTDSNGKNWSVQGLIQKMSDFTRRSGQEKQWTQNREQIVKSAVYQKLEGLGAKAEFENILNLQKANEILKAEYKATNKDVSMFGQSIPYELGQPMKVGMANATIDQANSEISLAYQRYVDEHTKDGSLPAPGALSAAFRRTGIPSSIAAKYAQDISKIQSMPDVEQPTKPTVTPKPTTTSIQNRSILTPAQESRLATPSKVPEKLAAQSLVHTSLPSGSKQVGTTSTGKPVFKTPDGQTIVEQ